MNKILIYIILGIFSIIFWVLFLNIMFSYFGFNWIYNTNY